MARRGITGGSYKPLSDEAVKKIDETVMRIIEEVGFEVNSTEALDLYEKAGARTDRTNNRVRLSLRKARELIAYLSRRERLDDLVKLGKTQRPDIIWEKMYVV